MSEGDEELLISYRLRRDEFPQLFANLAAVPKGPPRAARLKALVTQGFAAEQKIAEPSDESAIGTACPPQLERTFMDDLLDGKTEEDAPAGPNLGGGSWG
jgi:hypothetical protein